jgi:hypothetical protein
MTNSDDKRVIINGIDNRYITANLSETGGSLYSGKFTKFEVYRKNEQGSWFYETVPYNSLMSLPDAQMLGQLPTHVRVRDVLTSSYLYSEIVDGSSGIYFNSVGIGHEVTKDKPLILEFIKIEQDENGVATSIRVVGAMVHYAKTIS